MDSTDEEKDQQLERDDSLTDLASSASSSFALSALWTENSSRSTSASSFDIASSSEIPLSEVELATAAMEVAAREKCVGHKNNRVVSWGSTSVIGRRCEMEDAVAIVPCFISRTCSHIGGCAAPGSRTSGEVSPVYFFGVYDSHNGSKETAKKTVPVATAGGFDDDRWQRRWPATFTGGFEKADDEILAEAVAPEIVGFGCGGVLLPDYYFQLWGFLCVALPWDTSYPFER
ncbi:unnamed protein product [Linum tenue]|uniref:Protein-serine/threonine phosphatase n=1 Tax=Linum tenue TaxID=586396 RepID=A0AAV0KT63_9ROSI|nr:unnamed protein product [Linum tenue]